MGIEEVAVYPLCVTGTEKDISMLVYLIAREQWLRTEGRLVPTIQGINTVVGQCGLYSQILSFRVDKDVRNHLIDKGFEGQKSE